jgi:phage terminase large subunit
MGSVDTEIRVSELAAFTARQQEAWEATFTHRFVLYGGARGGGKSRLLRWWCLLWLMYQFFANGRRGVRVMLACETYRDLADRQITKIKTEFPSWAGQVKSTEADGLCFFLADELGGGMIALRNLDDPSKYQSAEFAAIVVDEITKTLKETFDILRGSLRWPGIEHTVFLAATNPGGRGHSWVKALWIDRQFPPEMMKLAEQFIFVKSLPADNPHLSQSYWDDLNSLPPKLADAWVRGDWNVFAGMAFPAWNESDHVLPADTVIPAHWPRMRGIDWGYAAPFCCLWGAKDPDTGRIIIYREAYQTELTDAQQARLVRELSAGETIQYSFADPSMWGRKTAGNIVTSTADAYRAEGIILTPGDNDRLSGKRKIDRLLQPLPDGRPGLQVTANCKNLIRTMPLLAYDETRVEDIDTTQEDHAYDACRYLLSTVAEVVKKREQPANPWLKQKVRVR